jgi:hypothetical protein
MPDTWRRDSAPAQEGEDLRLLQYMAEDRGQLSPETVLYELIGEKLVVICA